MASDSELGLAPPAAKHRPPTTITDIGQDLLLEIFILLPSLPSLVRAAIACRTFLHAVRSSRTFRRRFQEKHPPQLLGFFTNPRGNEIPTFTPLRRRSDPDLTAAVRGADFLLTRLQGDSCNPSLGWEILSCHNGYLVLGNKRTDQIAAYNPFTKAVDLFPQPPDQITDSTSNPLMQEPSEEDVFSPFLSPFCEFHIVFSAEEDQGVFRMLSVLHRTTQRQVQTCIAVFSSATREWKVSPWVETPTPLQPEGDLEQLDTFYAGVHANGLVYWKHVRLAYVLVLDTATLQFSRLDLPSILGEVHSKLFSLGHTKDGRLCMVAADDSNAHAATLRVWFWKADDDGVEKWMLEDTYSLSAFVDANKSTEGHVMLEIGGVIDGFVYLSNDYDVHTQSLLSLCLETGKVNKLFDDTYATHAHPYIMAWPPSFVYNKEDSQTKVT